MPRGWRDRSEISSWVDVSSVAGRPKWKEVEEHPTTSILEKETTTTIPARAQMECRGPSDDHLHYELSGDGYDSSFPGRPKGKVTFNSDEI